MKNTNVDLAVREKKAVLNGVEIPLQCILLNLKNFTKKSSCLHPHYHEYIEFLFGLEDCSVDAWIAGDRVHFGNGDLLIIHANVSHDFEYFSSTGRYICIKVLPEAIYFSENPMYDVKYVVPFLQPNLLPYQFFTKEDLRESGISTLIQEMMETFQKQEYGYEIALKSRFLQMFLWVIRYNHQNRCTPMEPSTEVSYENVRLIQKSIEYINTNYADITETDAAAHANMSYSYYSKLFRRVVGKNFNSYLTTVRVNEAERLLLSSNLSVTEIAFATGFSTSSHFIETFRKVKKTTPKQYRLKWKQE